MSTAQVKERRAGAAGMVVGGETVPSEEFPERRGVWGEDRARGMRSRSQGPGLDETSSEEPEELST